MTEFALVVPILFFMMFGILETGLLMFTIGTARLAAGEGARQAAQSGNAANADTLTLQVVRNTALGKTGIAQVVHVDIYRLNQAADGTLSQDASRVNQYNPDGSFYQGTTLKWPPSSRNVTSGQTDFVGLTIYYIYTWKTGFFLGSAPMKLNQSFYVRLEPQTY
jgi:Flp pilus assembly protein TadG